MRTMTITEALVELKLLDARIMKAGQGKWVMAVKGKDKDTKEKEFEEQVKAKHDSIMSLIEERKKIKAAIVKSNAVTELKVANELMTVAEAIERKTSIIYELKLMEYWKNELAKEQQIALQENKYVQDKVDRIIESLASSDKEDITEASKTITENYMDTNGWTLLDPIGLEQKIEELEIQGQNFMSNVDTALSLSNATTMIEV